MNDSNLNFMERSGGGDCALLATTKAYCKSFGTCVSPRTEPCIAKVWPTSGDLFPEGGIARSEQRILASIKAQEVVGLGVCGMVLARFPDFIKQVGRGPFGGAIEIVAQAAVFFACGTDEGAEFRFEKNVLPLARAQDHQQRRGVLRQLAGFAGTVAPLASRT